MMEIVVFSTKNLTIDNFTNFQKFSDKTLLVYCENIRHYFLQFFRLKRLRFSYFIMKRVRLQFSRTHTVYIIASV